MKDGGFNYSAGFIALGLTALTLEYLYHIVGPAYFQVNFVVKAVDLAYQYREPIRIGFFVFSILSWLLFGYSEWIGKLNKKNKNYKYIALVIFVASAAAIWFGDLYDYQVYVVVYPLALFLYLSHGFILSNIFKKKEEEEDDFFFGKAKEIEETAYSFNWNCGDDGWLNIVSPFRHIFITGSPGAGKSYTIVKPMIRTIVQKGYTGIIYDWKAPELIKVVVDAFMYHANREPAKGELKNYPLWLNKKTAGPLLSKDIIEPFGGRSDIEKFTHSIRQKSFYHFLNKISSYQFEKSLREYELLYKNEDFGGSNVKIVSMLLFPNRTRSTIEKEKEFYKSEKKKVIIEQNEPEKKKRDDYEKKREQSLLRLIGIKKPPYEEYMKLKAEEEAEQKKLDELYPKRAKERLEKDQKKLENKKAKNYSENRKIWIVNFSEPHKSHRVNPIAPDYLLTPTHAAERASSFIKNLSMQDGESKADPFFESNAIAYLQCIIWYLKEEIPEKCSLPYAISISLLSYPKVISMLLGNKDCANIIASIKTADDTNAEGQLAGVVSSLQTPIGKLSSPEIFYIFSGNDFNLRLNTWDDPGLLLLTNNDELASVYSPVAALIISSTSKLMNQKGRRHSVLNIDESPTLKIPKLSNLLGTCRSNMLSVQLFAQTYTQWLATYGQNEAKTILGTTGNQLFGNCGVEDDAKLAQAAVGQRNKTKFSTNKNKSKGNQTSKSEGENTSTARQNLIEVHEMANLETGRFIGKVCDVRKGDPTIVNVLPIIKEPDELYKYDQSITKNPNEDRPEKMWVDLDDMMEKMRENMEFIRVDAEELVDIGCRLAIYKGIAGDLNPLEREKRIFQQHFDPETGKRVMDIMGNPVN